MPRRTLAERIQNLEAKKAALQLHENKLNDEKRRRRNAEVFKAGLLIEKAGLLDTPPNVLLGALLELADQVKDAAKTQSWERRGGPILEREAAARKRPMEIEPA